MGVGGVVRGEGGVEGHFLFFLKKKIGWEKGAGVMIAGYS